MQRRLYFNIHVDKRVNCAVPTFFIGEHAYYFPVVSCHTMCGGMKCVDPATGRLVETGGAR